MFENIKKILSGGKKEIVTWQKSAAEAIKSKPETEATFYGNVYPIYTKIYDGEKTQGELGAPLNYVPDFTGLAFRSWQAYVESDIAQIIVNAFLNWVIGPGLKLQSEPVKSVIDKNNVSFNSADFIETTETRFRLFSGQNVSSYSMMGNLHTLARMAYKHAIIGGDVLCVVRTGKNGPNMQLINGIRIKTPLVGEHIKKAKEAGNKIINGVEINKKGEHIRYFVANNNLAFITNDDLYFTANDSLSYTAINAKGPKTKRLQAFLLYGNEYRIDSVRGLPLLSAVLEKIKKLDRYTEATVGSAEERAKIPFTIEHNLSSDGENPFIAEFKQAAAAGEGTEKSGIDVNDSIKKVAMTTGKTPVNMPIGAALKALESKIELNFGEFLDKNFIYIAASIEIPYEVALSKYENSFSSSRMAAKSWEHTMKVKRKLFSDVYYKPFYNIFLELEILKGNITAAGYQTSLMSKDIISIAAYKDSRFIGPNVPHVDPLKEVKAEVEKIKNFLTTYEKATEDLNSGEFSANAEKQAIEKKKIRDLKLIDEENNTND